MANANKIIDIAERVKGAALILIGGVLLYFAIDNYIKVSTAEIGAVIRVPRILEWCYDNLGLTPSVVLHSLLAAAIIGFGIRKIAVGKRLAA